MFRAKDLVPIRSGEGCPSNDSPGLKVNAHVFSQQIGRFWFRISWSSAQVNSFSFCGWVGLEELKSFAPALLPCFARWTWSLSEKSYILGTSSAASSLFSFLRIVLDNKIWAIFLFFWGQLIHLRLAPGEMLRGGSHGLLSSCISASWSLSKIWRFGSILLWTWGAAFSADDQCPPASTAHKEKPISIKLIVAQVQWNNNAILSERHYERRRQWDIAPPICSPQDYWWCPDTSPSFFKFCGKIIQVKNAHNRQVSHANVRGLSVGALLSKNTSDSSYLHRPQWVIWLALSFVDNLRHGLSCQSTYGDHLVLGSFPLQKLVVAFVIMIPTFLAFLPQLDTFSRCTALLSKKLHFLSI